jgi:DNA polymerase-1
VAAESLFLFNDMIQSTASTGPGACFLLIDALGLAYRSYYAIRDLTGPGGQPTNAAYGFLRTVQMFIERFSPGHIGVVFDAGIPEVRTAILPEYKAQRPPMPDGLRQQLPVIESLAEAFGWKTASLPGWEADDVIATLAKKAIDLGSEVLIMTADKDILQLVCKKVSVVGFGKTDPPLGADGVQTKLGVRPEQVVDYLALLGDQADNIAGVPGVGKKTACQLIEKYGDIEGIIENLDQVHPPRIRSALECATGRLQENRALIALHTDLDLPWSLSEFRLGPPPDWDHLVRELRTQGFEKMASALPRQGELF